MRLSDFDYALPDDRIAQEPARQRDEARLMRLDRRTGVRAHHRVADLPGLLAPGDLVVANDTRVFPARLLGRRDPSGGAVECLLLAPLGADRWDALVHPGQKLKPGARAVFDRAGHRILLEVLERHFHGRRTVQLTVESGHDLEEAIDAVGHVPLPPYIKRAARSGDQDRYQTIFATVRGSVAAPTAGLHFTPRLLRQLTARGIAHHTLTLHVGYGTFAPVRADDVTEHEVAPERYALSAETADAINSAREAGRRIVAVGTTVTRALETVARTGERRLRPGAGETDLAIYPGFEFLIVDGLLTNFHLPRSSLLLLVSAFAGRNRLMTAYAEAIRERYRFYSYGDAMLVV